MVRNMPAAKPERPSHLPHGRWLGDFPDLSDAEKRLVKDCAAGTGCVLGATRPETATTENTIRADLIRFLALGGCEANPVHENGVQLAGAWVEGKLDLNNATVKVDLQLEACRFSHSIVATDSKLAGLYLSGSQLAGILADRMVVTGSLFLCDGFIATGEVGLLGAQIGGNLVCNRGTFSSMRTGGTSAGDALNVEHIVVKGALFVRKANFIGRVNLTAAYATSLIDDENCWPTEGVLMDGFRYDRIGAGSTGAPTRVKWLEAQYKTHIEADFRPQPWEQLIKVLRDMGHPAEAAEIAMAKQLAMRSAGKIGNRIPRSQYVGWRLWLDSGWVKVSNWIARRWHWVYGALAGFGYRPARILLWMIGMCLLSGWYFSDAASSGIIAPASAEIFAHKQIHADLGAKGTDSAACGIQREVPPARYWTQCSALPSEYTTFNAWVYSLDLILPLVDLQQDSQWAPSATYTDAGGVTRNLWGGMIARFIMWFEILFGWFASLMFVAIAGRLVEKD